MRTIGGKPYIDCAPFIDMEGLKQLEVEICLGIAKSGPRAGIYGDGIKDESIRGSWVKFNQQVQRGQHGVAIKEQIESLDANERSTFFKLYFGLYNPSSTVYIRTFKDGFTSEGYAKKASRDGTVFTNNAQYFPNLIKWIDSLPFEEYGRVLFFIHEHDCELLAHRDGPFYRPHKNEFLWLNPCSDKKLYVLDEDTNERHYIETDAAFFNDLSVHGGDRYPRMTWSLRVDGIFTDSFREQLGISNLTSY